MKIHIKRFDAALPLPQYQTNGAVCFDCHVRETVTIEPQTTGLIPLNIALKLPKGYCALLAARSSLYKRGLSVPNGIGIFDEDYCGDGDEYRFPVFNFTNAPITIPRGDRVAQVLLFAHTKAKLYEVKKLGKKNRGGLGTTGK